MNALIKKLFNLLSDQNKDSLLRFLIRQKGYTTNNIFPLEDIHIESCKLLKDRDCLITKLPSSNEIVIAEIGVHQGKYSESIINAIIFKKLYLIDTWKDRLSYNMILAKFEFNENIKIIKGDSIHVLENLPDQTFDWVYLDTTHTYDQTKMELKILKDKVKNNGLICGHDYTKGNWKNHIRYGVIEAVHEFCINELYQFKYLTLETNGFRSFALQKIPDK